MHHQERFRSSVCSSGDLSLLMLSWVLLAPLFGRLVMAMRGIAIESGWPSRRLARRGNQVRSLVSREIRSEPEGFAGGMSLLADVELDDLEHVTDQVASGGIRGCESASPLDDIELDDLERLVVTSEEPWRSWANCTENHVRREVTLD